MLENIINWGKRSFVVALIALSSTSCFPGAWGPERAKRDYWAYPECRKEIALYNIKRLLAESCQDHFFEKKVNYVAVNKFINEESLSCYTKSPCEYTTSMRECTSSGFSRDSPPRCYDVVTCLIEGKKVGFEGKWSDISAVEVKNNCVKLNNNKDCNFYVKDDRQASELAEAIRFYVRL